jgi:hypothetical protein
MQFELLILHLKLLYFLIQLELHLTIPKFLTLHICQDLLTFNIELLDLVS